MILDNRRDLEWAEARIDGAVHIPLHELRGRLDEFDRAAPAGMPVVTGA